MSSPVLRWSCLAGGGVGWWAGAPVGILQEFSIKERLLVVFSSNPGLLLLPFMGISYMQLNDGFEAGNKTASPFLWCTYKSVNTIPLSSSASQCRLGLEENSKCQAAKGQGQPAKRVKISPLYSLSLASAHNCAFLFCLAVPWAVSVPWGKTYPEGGPRTTKQPKGPQTERDAIAAIRRGVCAIDLIGV